MEKSREPPAYPWHELNQASEYALNPSAPSDTEIYSTIQEQQVSTAKDRKNPHIVPITFGPDPTVYTCPKCEKNIKTVTHKYASGTSLLVSTVVLCATLYFGLAGVLLASYPTYQFVYKRYRDVKHRCPDCGLKLGLFKVEL